MIEDRELRDLFRAESAEHLQKIEAGLLRLQAGPADAPLLSDVFREAHSLKGAARMLGLREVQNLAHGIESRLGEARTAQRGIDPTQVPTQLARLDRIRHLVAQALGDEPTPPAPVPAPAAPPPPTAAPGAPSTLPPPVSEPAAVAGWSGVGLAPAPPELGAHTRPDPARPLPDFRIHTLRVESSRLDALLQLGGELIVSTGRLAHRETELDQLLTRCEDHLKQRPANPGPLAEVTTQLAGLRHRMAADTARLDAVARQIESGIRSLRLVPLATLLEQFPRMVHDLGSELGKPLDYQLEGAHTVADKHLIEELKAPLMHLLRNAIDHGIEPPAERQRAGKPERGLIRITVTQDADGLAIAVSDDGRGLDLDAIRQQALKQRLHTPQELPDLTDEQLQALIFQPGFSTARTITDLSGRGVGLDVVRSSVEQLRGSLTIASAPGQGVTFHLRLPVALTATRTMLLREWGETYALPFDDIVCITRVRPAQLPLIAGRRCLLQDRQAIRMERLGALLERAPPPVRTDDDWHCVVLKVGTETFALALDEVLATADLVVKPTTPPLTRVRNVAGLAVLATGLVCPVLNPYDLLRSLTRTPPSADPAPAGDPAAPPPKRILLVEDSISTRIQERRILEAAGYTVVTAADGLDAWNLLSVQPFDAVVSDIAMPRMSGLELAAKVRANHQFAELPIVLVTSLASDEDRRRGLATGADAYLGKSAFDQDLLLDCLARLV